MEKETLIMGKDKDYKKINIGSVSWIDQSLQQRAKYLKSLKQIKSVAILSKLNTVTFKLKKKYTFLKFRKSKDREWYWDIIVKKPL